MTAKMLTVMFAAISLVLSGWGLANAQDTTRETPVSTCMAVADNQWHYQKASISPEHFLQAGLPVVRANISASQINTLAPSEVKISYVAHSTFRIEDATGLKIATDYAGFAGRNVVPDVVTMNHAHSTHYTLTPDPRIEHVLPGWGKDGKPARYNLKIGEAIVRNVNTDINNQWVGYEPDGNSIFIFEMGGLCIGHLGHLHHLLTERHYAQIGRLDVLMVPVDGGYTMSVEDMTEVVNRLQASVILPMHWFGEGTLQRFLTEIRGRFPVERLTRSDLVLSLNTLPAQPSVMVLSPEGVLGIFDGD